MTVKGVIGLGGMLWAGRRCRSHVSVLYESTTNQLNLSVLTAVDQKGSQSADIDGNDDYFCCRELEIRDANLAEVLTVVTWQYLPSADTHMPTIVALLSLLDIVNHHGLTFLTKATLARTRRCHTGIVSAFSLTSRNGEVRLCSPPKS